VTNLSADDCKTIGDDLRTKLKILSGTIWQARANSPQIDSWLANFTGEVVATDTERTYALYLLTRLMYYGQREIRALLRALYRDLFRYPILSEIRRANGDTKDSVLLNNLFEQELQATRFVGLGDVATSGPMLLYELRLATELRDDVFTTLDAILAGKASDVPPAVKRYVFIDDLCATGDQATGYSRDLVEPIRSRYGSSVELLYFVMFATAEALGNLMPPATNFDRVRAVHVLDESFKSFGPNSRYFPAADGKLDLATGKATATRYGAKLSGSPLGYGNCQLLLAFQYNTPDNTLPIIWSKVGSWTPIFERRS
jgi:hypothetical protein